jgi:hypothetical protein
MVPLRNGRFTWDFLANKVVSADERSYVDEKMNKYKNLDFRNALIAMPTQ